jgi:hypothetical protein
MKSLFITNVDIALTIKFASSYWWFFGKGQNTHV